MAVELDWGVLGTLTGVLFGAGIGEYLARGRERRTAVRYARALLHELYAITAEVERAREKRRQPLYDAIPARVEHMHSPTFADVLALLPPRLAFFLAASCRIYELHMREHPKQGRPADLPPIDTLTDCTRILEAQIDLLEALPCHPTNWWAARGRIRQWDGVVRGKSGG